MALTKRNRSNMDIWPGFVDALATLLMVIIFLLLIFVISQVYLNDALVGRDKALDKLNLQVSELADMLKLEQATGLDLKSQVGDLSQELRASLSKRDGLQSQLASLRGENSTIKGELVASQNALAKVNAKLLDAYQVVDANKETIETQIGKLALLNQKIEALEALKEELKNESASKLANVSDDLIESRAETALLNQQLKALGSQMEELAKLLDASEIKDAEAQVQIQSLGKRLNKALASKVQELSKYRSEFFGRLRKILGNRQGIQIVNDRFVFQSEVLFESGSADLGEAGKEQLTQLADSLLDISKGIPEKINWVMLVEGHTDAEPIFSAKFPSNWELSAARAISVVKYLRNAGLPANRLAAAGYGEFQPLDSRDDEIAYRRNRRIELKLTQR